MRSFSPIQYLQIDIANSFGLDKLTFDERLQWFNDHQLILEELACNAEETAQYVAGVQAYRKAEASQPTGYLCGMDATASGLQILALLAGCETSASICNLVNTGRREDAYVRVYQRVQAILGSKGSVERKALKAALMTHLYGSKAEPKKAFGEDTPELAAFYQAIDEMLPGANMLNHDLLSLWNPQAYVHEWILPDGFEVKIKVEDTVEHPVQFLGQTYSCMETVNRPKEKGLSMGANIVHSIDGMIVREMNRRCNFDADKLLDIYALVMSQEGSSYALREKDFDLLRILELHTTTGFMSAVVLEYIDEYNAGHLDDVQRQAVINLIESLPPKPFKLLCIHDCFKFHANYGDDVREQYIRILAELADSDVLSSIATQLRGTPTTVKKLSPNLASKIRESEYAIC